LELVPDPPRPLRRSGWRAFRARGAYGADRGSDRHRAGFAVDVASRRRRLLPTSAVRHLALVATPHQRRRPPSRDVLLSPVGARPGAAASARAESEDTIPALREPRPDGSPAATARARLPLGPRRLRLPQWRHVMELAAEAMPRVGREQAPALVRAL